MASAIFEEGKQYGYNLFDGNISWRITRRTAKTIYIEDNYGTKHRCRIQYLEGKSDERIEFVEFKENDWTYSFSAVNVKEDAQEEPAQAEAPETAENTTEPEAPATTDAKTIQNDLIACARDAAPIPDYAKAFADEWIKAVDMVQAGLDAASHTAYGEQDLTILLNEGEASVALDTATQGIVETLNECIGSKQMKHYGCQKYQNANCDNCGYSCKDDGGEEQWCENWMPCRGGHPSTPNPCECSSSKEYGLFLNECAGCPHIAWED